MSLLVIFVKKRDFEGSDAWRGPEDVPLNAARHFRDDELSIYRVPTDADIPRLIAAFALGHPERLEQKDFIAVFEALVDLSGLNIEIKDGDVPDPIVRTWHRNIIGVGDNDAKSLAFSFASQGYCRRVRLALVRALVVMSHDRQYLVEGELHEDVRVELGRCIAASTVSRCGSCGHRDDAHANEGDSQACGICCLVPGSACCSRVD